MVLRDIFVEVLDGLAKVIEGLERGGRSCGSDGGLCEGVKV